MIASLSSISTTMLIPMVILAAAISIIVMPSSCDAFTVQSAIRARPSSRFGNSADDSTEWWKDVEMEHADLPQSVIPDFPILSTRLPSSDDTDGNTEHNDSNSKRLIYFDSAATSQKPTLVTSALTSYYHTSNSNVHRGAHALSRSATEQYEASRDKLKSFLNAPSRDEIIFTSGATESLNLLASTYGRANVEKGDEILITELEHHSNIVPWQLLAEEKGAVLKFIPLNVEKGCLDIHAIATLVTNRTKIVSIQHVSNVMGCITPLSTITPLIRTLAHPSCKIILDACQSVPHMPIDVQSPDLDIDFLAASGHKMCGPTGIGFLWGKLEVLNSMPPYMGGGEMIDEVRMDKSTFALSPARFEAGTPSIAQAIGLGAAVDYLTQIGMDKIEAYEQEIGAYLYKRMIEVEGIKVLGPGLDEARGTAIVAFVAEGVHPSDLGTFLDLEGVAVRAGHHCCQPLHRKVGISHSARASLYFYNTKEEVDVFIEKLEETLLFLGGGSGGVGKGGGGEEEFVPFF